MKSCDLIGQAIIYFFDSDKGVFPDWSEYPLVVLVTSIIWIAVTFFTKPESDEVLQNFCKKIQPGGPGWKKFNDMLISHDQKGSANTLLGVQSQRPNLYKLKSEISKIITPTLIINGDEDDMCIEVGVYLKRIISTSGLVVVPKTGHTINLEEPSLFNQYLASFYQSIENNSWKSRDHRAEILIN